MRSPISAVVFIATAIAMAGLLLACKPKAEPAPVVAKAPVEEAPAAPGAEMLEACTIKMSQPEVNEWTTYWDTSAVLQDGEGPSSAHSVFWANDEEKKKLARGSSALPLSIRCTSDGPPSFSVSMAAFTSTEKEVPMDSGEYTVVGKAQGQVQPGQFLASSIMLGQRMFEVTRGTLNIDRFDTSSVRGRFRLEGTESGENGAEFELEGSFDIPCRGGSMESACEARRTVAR
jgi:hypothetical protein